MKLKSIIVVFMFFQLFFCAVLFSYVRAIAQSNNRVIMAVNSRCG